MTKNRSKTGRSQQRSKSAPNPANESEWEEMRETEREIEKTNLSFRQQSALPAIAASSSIAQAARNSRIGESTLYRWLEDDRFRSELTRLRQESAELARHELQGLMLRSVSILSEAMDDPDMAVRLRAARYAMSFAVRICETGKLDKDIQDLEDALSLPDRPKHATVQTS